MRFRETAPDSELRKSLFDALPFFQWFTNGHFQNSEANFRTFLVRNTQVLFLLLCITLYSRFYLHIRQVSNGKNKHCVQHNYVPKYVLGAVNGHIINIG